MDVSQAQVVSYYNRLTTRIEELRATKKWTKTTALSISHAYAVQNHLRSTYPSLFTK